MSERRGLRARLVLRPGQHRPRPVRIGIVAIVVVGFVLYAGFSRTIPFVPKGGTVVRAEFERNVNLRGATQVRVHGVTVGTVEKVEHASGGRGAVVTMRIDDGKGVDLRSDARAAVWWRTLLGRNMYVELEPGSARTRLGDRTIPRSRTTTQTELDEVLEPLDRTGRKAVQTMLREFDRGLADAGAVSGTIDALEPTMKSLSPAARALRGTRTGDLNRLVVGTSRAMGALARSESDLGGLIDSANVTLGVTAAQRADLGAAIAGAPAALRQTRATARRLHATLDELDPLAAELRPGARALESAAELARPALTALDRVLAHAEPTLVRLQPTSESLAEMAPDLRGVVNDAKPAVERTHDEIIPFLNERDRSTKRRNFEMIGPTLSGAGSITAPFDDNGHVIRFQAGLSDRALGTSSAVCETFLLDPTENEKVDCSMLTDALKAVLGAGPPPTRKANSGNGGRGR